MERRLQFEALNTDPKIICSYKEIVIQMFEGTGGGEGVRLKDCPETALSNLCYSQTHKTMNASRFMGLFGRDCCQEVKRSEVYILV